MDMCDTDFETRRQGGLLEAYQRQDPAARSKLEIFLLYPGVHAISLPSWPTGFTAGIGNSWPAASPSGAGSGPELKSTQAPKSAAAW